MKIAIIGFGKMGQEIYKLATDMRLEISAIIDPTSSMATSNEINVESIKGADICIEFSSPSSALGNLTKLIELRKKFVVGTTGWHDKLPFLKMKAKSYNTSFVYGSNFSIGMLILNKLANSLNEQKNLTPHFNLSIQETHHTKKKDTPSGSAIDLANKLNQKIPIESIRKKDVIATHTLVLDSPFEEITMTHTAKNRAVFAHGALHAAQFLYQNEGVYSFEEILDQREVTC